MKMIAVGFFCLGALMGSAFLWFDTQIAIHDLDTRYEGLTNLAVGIRERDVLFEQLGVTLSQIRAILDETRRYP